MSRSNRLKVKYNFYSVFCFSKIIIKMPHYKLLDITMCMQTFLKELKKITVNKFLTSFLYHNLYCNLIMFFFNFFVLPILVLYLIAAYSSARVSMLRGCNRKHPTQHKNTYNYTIIKNLINFINNLQLQTVSLFRFKIILLSNSF